MDIIDTINAMTARLDRAKDIVMKGHITHVDQTKSDYRVTSQADPTLHYQVTAKGCTCPDVEKGAVKGWCKHRLAVALVQHHKAQDRPATYSNPQTEPEQELCPFHNSPIFTNTSGARTWLGHKVGDEYCNGKGTKSERQELAA